jgi:sirohydrochlorin cobaltochelatase
VSEPRAGLILFAHGARDPRWAAPFEAIAAQVAAARPGLPLRLAYLEAMVPDLSEATKSLVGEGCDRIEILPLFLGTGGHLRSDVPPLVEGLRRVHAGVAIDLHGAIGDVPSVAQAIAHHALSLVAPR